MDKIAVLILAHNNERQLFRLIRSLNDARFDIYIHIDKQSDISLFKNIARESGKFLSSICFIENRVSCSYLDFSLVQATLNLIASARKNGEYLYYVLLSGGDYPIKKIDDIYSSLTINYPTSYIDMYCVEEATKRGILWTNKIGRRAYSQKIRRFLLTIFGKKNYYSPYGKFIRMLARAYDIVCSLCIQSPRKRLHDMGYRLYIGSHFWMLPDTAINHILKSLRNEKLLKIFHNISPVEETFFQTLLQNFNGLKIPNPYVQFENQMSEMDNPAMRLIKWYENGSHTNGHPSIWLESDFDIIKNAKALFARKFSDEIDGAILNMIDKIILNNEYDEKSSQ